MFLLLIACFVSVCLGNAVGGSGSSINVLLIEPLGTKQMAVLP